VTRPQHRTLDHPLTEMAHQAPNQWHAPYPPIVANRCPLSHRPEGAAAARWKGWKRRSHSVVMTRQVVDPRPRGQGGRARPRRREAISSRVTGVRR
jgi:hypothetical protein